MLCCAFLLPSSCHKECFIPRYWFEIPFAVSLTAEPMNVGDTLWLESTYDFSLLDLNTNKLVDVGNFDMGTSLGFPVKLDTLPVEGNESVYFDFVAVLGEIVLYPPWGQLFYAVNAGGNTIKIGLIAKRPGIYSYNFYSAFYKYTIYSTDPNSINYFSRKATFSGADCPCTIYLTFRTSSDLEDNNFKLLSLTPDDPDYSMRLDDFNNRGGFMVEVIE